MLELTKVNSYYGSIHVLKDVSFEVGRNDLVSIIGANGAGKSTLLKTIAGYVSKKAGIIKFNGEEISRYPSDKIVKLGISIVLQGKQVFQPLTVVDNLMLGAYINYKRRYMKEIKNNVEFVFELFPTLKDRQKQLAGTLSGGEQQMLAIGRALMAEPTLLILDEPSSGLAPLIVTEIFNILKNIQGLKKIKCKSIILVEQNALAALQTANYAYVMENGKIMLEGNTSQLLDDERVKHLYLGL